MTGVQTCALPIYQGTFVAQPPIQTNIEGGRKEAVGSVMNGGSITITKGPALASGARRYVVQGAFIEVNQFRIFSGHVEGVRVDLGGRRIIKKDNFFGQNSDINLIGFNNDNGDGVVDYAYDADFIGNVTHDAASNTSTFTPPAGNNAMTLAPGTTFYVVIYFILSNPQNPSMPLGNTLSCYLGPNDLNVTGGDTTAGWVPRLVGDPVQRFGSEVYGWKAVVGTPYDTGGETGTGDVGTGNDTPDNGNPWSDANKDWTGGGGGGCFVATASFGSLSANVVEGLCDTRDSGFLSSYSGAGLVDLYYSVSPSVALELAETDALRALTRSILSR